MTGLSDDYFASPSNLLWVWCCHYTRAVPVLIRQQEQGQDQQHQRHHCCQEEDHHHGCCQEEDGKIGLLWALVGQGWDGVTIVAI